MQGNLGGSEDSFFVNRVLILFIMIFLFKRISFLSILTLLVFSAEKITFSKDKKEKSPSLDKNASLQVPNQGEKETKDLTETETIRAEIKPFKISLTLKGFIEDMDAQTLAIKTNYWSDLRVVQSTKQGKKVKKDEILVQLDHEKIRQQIHNLSHQLRLLEIDFQILEVELKLAESLVPIEMEAIELNEKYVKEDLERFKSEDLPFQKKSLQMNLKRVQDYLLYSQEELNQLEKMYQEDDLTEETEEIILQRAKNQVDYLKFSVESAHKNFEDFNTIQAPRSQKAMQDSFDREKLMFSAQRKTTPAEVKLNKLKLVKMEQEKKILVKKKRDLELDLKNMTLKSPVDGKVYWGTFERGKWSGTVPFKNKLQEGGNLKAYEEILTICPSKRFKAIVEIPEKDLSLVQKNLPGKLIFSSLPEEKINAKVESVSDSPHSPNKYHAILAFTLPKGFNNPAPGTACSFTFVAYEKKSAVTLPAKFVFKDDYDPEIKHVYVLNKSGKSRKKRIDVGKQAGETLEILSGITMRDKVLKEKPKN